MNKLKYLLIWCLVLGTFISCGDKEDEGEPASAAQQDYLPTTKGSTWNYGGITPYTLTVTGATKVVNGKTYYEMETKQGSDVRKSYVVKDKGVYTAIGFVPNSGEIELSILKEETPVGKPWEQTNVINGVETKMACTIVEKDVTKTVEGKTYKNVINVQMVTTFLFKGQDLGTAITTNYYYAKGVGLILSDFGAQGQVPLLTYDVK
jgi:hypothetical protein